MRIAKSVAEGYGHQQAKAIVGEHTARRKQKSCAPLGAFKSESQPWSGPPDYVAPNGFVARLVTWNQLVAVRAVEAIAEGRKRRQAVPPVALAMVVPSRRTGLNLRSRQAPRRKLDHDNDARRHDARTALLGDRLVDAGKKRVWGGDANDCRPRRRDSDETRVGEQPRGHWSLIDRLSNVVPDSQGYGTAAFLSDPTEADIGSVS